MNNHRKRTGIRADHYRVFGTDKGFFKHMLMSHELRYLWMFRKRQRTKNRFLLHLYDVQQILFDWKYGLLILTNQVGEGLLLGHGHGIHVSAETVIGRNCNLSKNCSVGPVMRGANSGSPVLGDRVWVGTGAMVFGNIKIGDDVLIAPNAFVNMDVPPHSIVSGNPCTIRHRDHATECYVNNLV